MAAFALPELLPNKWRHIGVVIADFTVYIAVIVAPVTARYGYELGTWEWNFWGIAIFQGLSCLGLLFLYHPPKHPYVDLRCHRWSPVLTTSKEWHYLLRSIQVS